jgi:hypothetical protein
MSLSVWRGAVFKSLSTWAARNCSSSKAMDQKRRDNAAGEAAVVIINNVS